MNSTCSKNTIQLKLMITKEGLTIRLLRYATYPAKVETSCLAIRTVLAPAFEYDTARSPNLQAPRAWTKTPRALL